MNISFSTAVLTGEITDGFSGGAVSSAFLVHNNLVSGSSMITMAGGGHLARPVLRTRCHQHLWRQRCIRQQWNRTVRYHWFDPDVQLSLLRHFRKPPFKGAFFRFFFHLCLYLPRCLPACLLLG